jgi:hypothetical protein
MIVEAPRFRPEASELASWWTPDQDLFSVFVSYDAASARFRDGPSLLSPLELAHRVRGQDQWGQQPIMLVTDGDPSGGAVQLIADYLQVPVITGSHPGMWLAVLPRRADRGRSPVIHLGRTYPFPEEQKKKLGNVSHLPRVLPPTCAVTAIAADEQGCALAMHGQPGADELLEDLRLWRSDEAASGKYGVVVWPDTADTDWPIRVGDGTRALWDVAEALWEIREHWQGEGSILTMLSNSPLPREDLQLGLLSAYLQAPVRGARIGVATHPTGPSVAGADAEQPKSSGSAPGHDDDGEDAWNSEAPLNETNG